MAQSEDVGSQAVEHARKLVSDEMMLCALKEGDVTGPSLLRRVVREEVQAALDRREMVEAALTRSLAEGRWVTKIEASVLTFLKKDFDKVLALGADAYHFRRWDELQSELRELRTSGGADQAVEVSHTRDLVGNVRDQHNELSSEVAALRERLDLAYERLEAVEGHSANRHETLERQKAFHFKILEEQSAELREEILREVAKSAAGFRQGIDDLRQDVKALKEDRTWLHRQEEAMSGRLREFDRRMEDISAKTLVVAQEAKGKADEVVAHVNETHAKMSELYADVRENHASSEVDLRMAISDQKTSIEALVSDAKRKHKLLLEDLRAEQVSKHEATRASVQELVQAKTSVLDEELRKSHAENKVLHLKLETAVVKGYEAVEAQFREALGQHIGSLRTEISQAQARFAEQQEELRDGRADGEAAFEQRLREATDEQIAQLRSAQELSERQVREDLQALRTDLDAATKGNREAVQGMQETLREAREALEGRHEDVAQRVAALDADKEARHRELRCALEEGDKAVEKRLNQAVSDSFSNLGEATSNNKGYLAASKEYSHKLHAMAYSLLEVIGEVELTGTPGEAQGKRNTLHNRLCDRLGGRMLAPGEDAGGHDRAPSELADPGKASRVASSLSASTRPGTAPTRPGTAPTGLGFGGLGATRPYGTELPVLPSFGNETFGGEPEGSEPYMLPLSPTLPPEKPQAAPTSRALQETPSLTDFAEGPVSLPSVVTKPSQPSTPKPARSPRFGDSLREIRNLRLTDYNSSNWGS